MIAAGAVAALAGFVAAWLWTRTRPSSPDPRLVRINVHGAEVPAVLGEGVVLGALLGVAVLAASAAGGWAEAETGPVGLAIVLVVGVFGAAGRWDDLRGDEGSRGFKGHLRAAAGGRVTGGLVKILAGGLAGLGAAALLSTRPVFVLEVGAMVALSANLLNLLDRAPGRAGKVWFAAAAPLMIWGSARWGLAAAGMLGGLVAVISLDLRARGMLGDTGANPLGAALGLGLATSLDRPARLACLAVLLGLNVASERWSFSRAIERTPALRFLDRLGRK